MPVITQNKQSVSKDQLPGFKVKPYRSDSIYRISSHAITQIPSFDEPSSSDESLATIISSVDIEATYNRKPRQNTPSSRRFSSLVDNKCFEELQQANNEQTSDTTEVVSTHTQIKDENGIVESWQDVVSPAPKGVSLYGCSNFSVDQVPTEDQVQNAGMNIRVQGNSRSPASCSSGARAKDKNSTYKNIPQRFPLCKLGPTIETQQKPGSPSIDSVPEQQGQHPADDTNEQELRTNCPNQLAYNHNQLQEASSLGLDHCSNTDTKQEWSPLIDHSRPAVEHDSQFIAQGVSICRSCGKRRVPVVKTQISLRKVQYNKTKTFLWDSNVRTQASETVDCPRRGSISVTESPPLKEANKRRCASCGKRKKACLSKSTKYTTNGTDTFVRCITNEIQCFLCGKRKFAAKACFKKRHVIAIDQKTQTNVGNDEWTQTEAISGNYFCESCKQEMQSSGTRPCNVGDKDCRSNKNYDALFISKAISNDRSACKCLATKPVSESGSDLNAETASVLVNTSDEQTGLTETKKSSGAKKPVTNGTLPQSTGDFVCQSEDFKDDVCKHVSSIPCLGEENESISYLMAFKDDLICQNEDTAEDIENKERKTSDKSEHMLSSEKLQSEDKHLQEMANTMHIMNVSSNLEMEKGKGNKNIPHKKESDFKKIQSLVDPKDTSSQNDITINQTNSDFKWISSEIQNSELEIAEDDSISLFNELPRDGNEVLEAILKIFAEQTVKSCMQRGLRESLVSSDVMVEIQDAMDCESKEKVDADVGNTIAKHAIKMVLSTSLRPGIEVQSELLCLNTAGNVVQSHIDVCSGDFKQLLNGIEKEAHKLHVTFEQVCLELVKTEEGQKIILPTLKSTIACIVDTLHPTEAPPSKEFHTAVQNLNDSNNIQLLISAASDLVLPDRCSLSCAISAHLSSRTSRHVKQFMMNMLMEAHTMEIIGLIIKRGTLESVESTTTEAAIKEALKSHASNREEKVARTIARQIVASILNKASLKSTDIGDSESDFEKVYWPSMSTTDSCRTEYDHMVKWVSCTLTQTVTSSLQKVIVDIAASKSGYELMIKALSKVIQTKIVKPAFHIQSKPGLSNETYKAGLVLETITKSVNDNGLLQEVTDTVMSSNSMLAIVADAVKRTLPGGKLEYEDSQLLLQTAKQNIPPILVDVMMEITAVDRVKSIIAHGLHEVSSSSKYADLWKLPCTRPGNKDTLIHVIAKETIKYIAAHRHCYADVAEFSNVIEEIDQSLGESVKCDLEQDLLEALTCDQALPVMLNVLQDTVTQVVVAPVFESSDDFPHEPDKKQLANEVIRNDKVTKIIDTAVNDLLLHRQENKHLESAMPSQSPDVTILEKHALGLVESIFNEAIAESLASKVVTTEIQKSLMRSTMCDKDHLKVYKDQVSCVIANEVMKNLSKQFNNKCLTESCISVTDCNLQTQSFTNFNLQTPFSKPLIGISLTHLMSFSSIQKKLASALSEAIEIVPRDSAVEIITEEAMKLESIQTVIHDTICIVLPPTDALTQTASKEITPAAVKTLVQAVTVETLQTELQQGLADAINFTLTSVPRKFSSHEVAQIAVKNMVTSLSTEKPLCDAESLDNLLLPPNPNSVYEVCASHCRDLTLQVFKMASRKMNVSLEQILLDALTAPAGKEILSEALTGALSKQNTLMLQLDSGTSEKLNNFDTTVLDITENTLKSRNVCLLLAVSVEDGIPNSLMNKHREALLKGTLLQVIDTAQWVLMEMCTVNMIKSAIKTCLLDVISSDVISRQILDDASVTTLTDVGKSELAKALADKVVQNILLLPQFYTSDLFSGLTRNGEAKHLSEEKLTNVEVCKSEVNKLIKHIKSNIIQSMSLALDPILQDIIGSHTAKELIMQSLTDAILSSIINPLFDHKVTKLSELPDLCLTIEHVVNNVVRSDNVCALVFDIIHHVKPGEHANIDSILSLNDDETITTVIQSWMEACACETFETLVKNALYEVLDSGNFNLEVKNSSVAKLNHELFAKTVAGQVIERIVHNPSFPSIETQALCKNIQESFSKLTTSIKNTVSSENDIGKAVKLVTISSVRNLLRNMMKDTNIKPYIFQILTSKVAKHIVTPMLGSVRIVYVYSDASIKTVACEIAEATELRCNNGLLIKTIANRIAESLMLLKDPDTLVTECEYRNRMSITVQSYIGEVIQDIIKFALCDAMNSEYVTLKFQDITDRANAIKGTGNDSDISDMIQVISTVIASETIKILLQDTSSFNGSYGTRGSNLSKLSCAEKSSRLTFQNVVQYSNSESIPLNLECSDLVKSLLEDVVIGHISTDKNLDVLVKALSEVVVEDVIMPVVDDQVAQDNTVHILDEIVSDVMETEDVRQMMSKAHAKMKSSLPTVNNMTQVKASNGTDVTTGTSLSSVSAENTNFLNENTVEERKTKDKLKHVPSPTKQDNEADSLYGSTVRDLKEASDQLRKCEDCKTTVVREEIDFGITLGSQMCSSSRLVNSEIQTIKQKPENDSSISLHTNSNQGSSTDSKLSNTGDEVLDAILKTFADQTVRTCIRRGIHDSLVSSDIMNEMQDAIKHESLKMVNSDVKNAIKMVLSTSILPCYEAPSEQLCLNTAGNVVQSHINVCSTEFKELMKSIEKEAHQLHVTFEQVCSELLATEAGLKLILPTLESTIANIVDTLHPTESPTSQEFHSTAQHLNHNNMQLLISAASNLVLPDRSSLSRAISAHLSSRPSSHVKEFMMNMLMEAHTMEIIGLIIKRGTLESVESTTTEAAIKEALKSHASNREEKVARTIARQIIASILNKACLKSTNIGDSDIDIEKSYWPTMSTIDICRTEYDHMVKWVSSTLTQTVTSSLQKVIVDIAASKSGYELMIKALSKVIQTKIVEPAFHIKSKLEFSNKSGSAPFKVSNKTGLILETMTTAVSDNNLLQEVTDTVITSDSMLAIVTDAIKQTLPGGSLEYEDSQLLLQTAKQNIPPILVDVMMEITAVDRVKSIIAHSLHEVSSSSKYADLWNLAYTRPRNKYTLIHVIAKETIRYIIGHHRHYADVAEFRNMIEEIDQSLTNEAVKSTLKQDMLEAMTCDQALPVMMNVLQDTVTEVIVAPIFESTDALPHKPDKEQVATEILQNEEVTHIIDNVLDDVLPRRTGHTAHKSQHSIVSSIHDVKSAASSTNMEKDAFELVESIILHAVSESLVSEVVSIEMNKSLMRATMSDKDHVKVYESQVGNAIASEVMGTLSKLCQKESSSGYAISVTDFEMQTPSSKLLIEKCLINVISSSSGHDKMCTALSQAIKTVPQESPVKRNVEQVMNSESVQSVIHDTVRNVLKLLNTCTVALSKEMTHVAAESLVEAVTSDTLQTELQQALAYAIQCSSTTMLEKSSYEVAKIALENMMNNLTGKLLSKADAIENTVLPPDTNSFNKVCTSQCNGLVRKMFEIASRTVNVSLEQILLDAITAPIGKKVVTEALVRALGKQNTLILQFSQGSPDKSKNFNSTVLKITADFLESKHVQLMISSSVEHAIPDCLEKTQAVSHALLKGSMWQIVNKAQHILMEMCAVNMIKSGMKACLLDVISSDKISKQIIDCAKFRRLTDTLKHEMAKKLADEVVQKIILLPRLSMPPSNLKSNKNENKRLTGAKLTNIHICKSEVKQLIEYVKLSVIQSMSSFLDPILCNVIGSQRAQELINQSLIDSILPNIINPLFNHRKMKVTKLSDLPNMTLTIEHTVCNVVRSNNICALIFDTIHRVKPEDHINLKQLESLSDEEAVATIILSWMEAYAWKTVETLVYHALYEVLGSGNVKLEEEKHSCGKLRKFNIVESIASQVVQHIVQNPRLPSTETQAFSKNIKESLLLLTAAAKNTISSDADIEKAAQLVIGSSIRNLLRDITDDKDIEPIMRETLVSKVAKHIVTPMFGSMRIVYAYTDASINTVANEVVQTTELHRNIASLTGSVIVLIAESLLLLKDQDVTGTDCELRELSNSVENYLWEVLEDLVKFSLCGAMRSLPVMLQIQDITEHVHTSKEKLDETVVFEMQRVIATTIAAETIKILLFRSATLKESSDTQYSTSSEYSSSSDKSNSQNTVQFGRENFIPLNLDYSGSVRCSLENVIMNHISTASNQDILINAMSQSVVEDVIMPIIEHRVASDNMVHVLDQVVSEVMETDKVHHIMLEVYDKMKYALPPRNNTRQEDAKSGTSGAKMVYTRTDAHDSRNTCSSTSSSQTEVSWIETHPKKRNKEKAIHKSKKPCTSASSSSQTEVSWLEIQPKSKINEMFKRRGLQDIERKRKKHSNASESSHESTAFTAVDSACTVSDNMQQRQVISHVDSVCTCGTLETKLPISSYMYGKVDDLMDLPETDNSSVCQCDVAFQNRQGMMHQLNATDSVCTCNIQNMNKPVKSLAELSKPEEGEVEPLDQLHTVESECTCAIPRKSVKLKQGKDYSSVTDDSQKISRSISDLDLVRDSSVFHLASYSYDPVTNIEELCQGFQPIRETLEETERVPYVKPCASQAETTESTHEAKAKLSYLPDNDVDSHKQRRPYTPCCNFRFLSAPYTSSCTSRSGSPWLTPLHSPNRAMWVTSEGSIVSHPYSARSVSRGKHRRDKPMWPWYVAGLGITLVGLYFLVREGKSSIRDYDVDNGIKHILNSPALKVHTIIMPD